MDPYYEQRVRDEVTYLHSLCHQGPPIPTPTPTPSRPKRKRLHHHHQQRQQIPKPNPQPNSGPICLTPPPAQISKPSSRALNRQAAARRCPLKLQQKASNAFREFVAKSVSYGDDDDSEDYWVDIGDEKYQFLLRVFVEDSQLRRYYEENFEGGEFCCLVCCGLGKKNSGKRFKSCLGLTQHSIAVSKSESNDSHRALAQVICRVLGWDFDTLPVIVFKGEPLGRIMAKRELNRGEHVASGVVQGNVVALNGNGGDLNVKDDSGDILRSDGAKLVICEGNVRDEGAHSDTDKGISETDGNEKAALGEQVPNQPLISISEWPCEKPVENSPAAALEWPAFKPHLASADIASAASLGSAEDQARLAAVQLQHDAVKTCQDYFTSKNGSDTDEYDEEDEEEDPSENSEDEEEDRDEDADDDDEDASKDSVLFTFFSKLFMENDGKLRDFYVNNSEAGEFCCLVCGGIGKKVWKRFKGCDALVQHSTAISKTKMQLAHRVYGQVVCRVLGWDINRLPSIVLTGEALAQPLENSGNSQGEPREDSDRLKDNLDLSTNNSDVLNCNNDEIVLHKDSGVHPNETPMRNELRVSSSSHVESSLKSAELLQGEPEENFEAHNDDVDQEFGDTSAKGDQIQRSITRTGRFTES